MTQVSMENWSALKAAVEVHERGPMIGSQIVKILASAGYLNAEIRLIAATMTTYVD